MPTRRISKLYQSETVFVTLTVIEWINIFTHKKYFDVLLESLKYCKKSKGLKLYGFVFMTNHIHLIISDINCKLDNIIRDYKHFTTTQIKKLLQQDRRSYILRLIENSIYKKKGQEFQIWQRENFPKFIETEEFFLQKLNYIHQNPVKKGYVEKPEDWKYSSAGNYYLNDYSLIKLDL